MAVSDSQPVKSAREPDPPQVGAHLDAATFRRRRLVCLATQTGLARVLDKPYLAAIVGPVEHRVVRLPGKLDCWPPIGVQRQHAEPEPLDSGVALESSGSRTAPGLMGRMSAVYASSDSP
ncbi:MAG: hypothetical protein ACRDZO_13905 [Egibacteraceae bacterium]